MRIKWSSEAAMEIAGQLERAEWAIEDSRGLIAMVRTALDEANPDGENQALRKASERFERDVVSMKKLMDLLNDTLAGVKRADQIMNEAERENASRADGMEEGSRYSQQMGMASAGRIDWSRIHSAPMPYLRISRAPLPEWLDNMTADPQIFTFIK